jgi:glycosyltransferase involved in cell wall biosynthesis
VGSVSALSPIVRALRRCAAWLLEMCVVPGVVLAAIVGRYSNKRIDVGLGPEPLINNVYHKKALAHAGFTAETFVSDVYFITNDFDVRADLRLPVLARFSFARRVLIAGYLFTVIVRRYRCVYIYFNGGPLSIGTRTLARLEPWLFKLARVKVLVMPYGGDVQDMTQASNLHYKHAIAADYPLHRLRQSLTSRQVRRWTRHADHVISGCDWVDYMHHWDTLMLGHFSIDVAAWTALESGAPEPPDRVVRVLHAPNHRNIKGTHHFVCAVAELAQEGLPVELVMVEAVPNAEIRRLMESADVVADQLVIGWYAMFAIEAMAMGKPVLCYLRDDLRQLYEDTGLVTPGEIPIVSCTPATLKSELRSLVTDRARRDDAGRRGPEFVRKHHSTEAIGAVFTRINASLGILPRAGG